MSAMFLTFLPLRGFAGESGARGVSFLKAGAGPRAVGMGEASTAVVNDAYASNWNPAALVRLTRAEAAFTHQNSFQDVKQQNFNLAFPLNERFALGAYALRQSVESFSGYDGNGNPADDVESSDSAYGGAFGFGVTRNLSIGGAAKLIRSSLGPASASSHAYDVGVLMRIPISLWRVAGRSFNIGAAMQNLGPSLVYDVEKTKLPQTSRVGLGFETPWGANQWTLAADYNFSPDHASYVTVGQEFWLKRVLALRAGYRSGQEEGSGLRVGIGIGIKSVQVAYSLSTFGFMGDTHRFGISFQFGRPIAAYAPKKLAVVEPVPATAPVSKKPVPYYLSIPVSTSSALVAPDGQPVPIKPIDEIIAPKKTAPEKVLPPLYKTKKRLLPGTAKELTEKGTKYFQEGRYDEAAVAFGQALRIEPNNKEALELMRKALNELDRKKKREKGVYE